MKRSSSWIAVLPSLVIPVCMGLMMYLGLFFLIQQEILSNEMVLRYITGHPVSKVTVGMFFIGLASLALIAKNVFEQFGAERKITVRSHQTDEGEPEESGVEPQAGSVRGIAESAVALERGLVELPSWMHEHYLCQRISNALHFLERTNSTSGIEDEMKYLADLDVDRQQQRYSLVQILIWATPMLGFLGTVLGISQALGGINVGPDNNFQQMMDGLRGSLYIAFDTTALALTLSMILMFGQFLIERFESQLLELVDQRSRSEIAGQFDLSAADSSDSVDRIAEEVWDASRDLVEKQTEVWRKSIQSAENAWTASLTDVSAQVQSNLSAALEDNVAHLAHYLGESIEKADTAMSHRWEQWQVTLSDNARLMSDHQRQVTEQTRIILRLAKQAENSELFHSAIEQNLAGIEATKKLKVTLDALSSAIRGLNKAAAVEPTQSKRPPQAQRSHPHQKTASRRESTTGEVTFQQAEVIIPFHSIGENSSAVARDKLAVRNSSVRSPNKAA